MKCLLCLALLLFYTTANAQEKCTLKEAPEVRGFKLGQTLAETKSRLQSVRFVTASDEGYSTEILDGYALRLKDREQFKDISSVWISFLDGKLVSIDIRYDNSIKWNDATEFSNKVSDALKLPKIWLRENSFTNHLDCDGFFIEVRVFKGLETTLIIKRSDLEATLQKRREAAEEKKRQDFKPE
jgi:hypothetical protein